MQHLRRTPVQIFARPDGAGVTEQIVAGPADERLPTSEAAVQDEPIGVRGFRAAPRFRRHQRQQVGMGTFAEEPGVNQEESAVERPAEGVRVAGLGKADGVAAPAAQIRAVAAGQQLRFQAKSSSTGSRNSRSASHSSTLR